MLIKTEAFPKNDTPLGWIVFIDKIRFPAEGYYDTTEGDAVYRALADCKKYLEEKNK